MARSLSFSSRSRKRKQQQQNHQQQHKNVDDDDDDDDNDDVKDGDGPAAIAKKNMARSVVAAQRTAQLTHGTSAKMESLRVNLHLERTKRSLKELRERLERWDPLVTDNNEPEQFEKRKDSSTDEALVPPHKKKNPNDPSTWKLKGAARPASEVYDFDVRYVDRYAQDHIKAKESVQRHVNRIAQGNLASFALGRKFLALLMQVGHLSQEAKLYRQARDTWMECLQLEGSPPVTTAREEIMKLCVRRRKFQEVYDLAKNYDDETKSTVVCYSTALAAFALQNGVNGAKSTKHKKKKNGADPDLPGVEYHVNDKMLQAIRCNVFLAYYIVHLDTFRKVMECQHELEEAQDEDEEADGAPPPSLLAEAIAYGHSDQIAVWHELVGARDTLERMLQTTSPGGQMVDWEGPLDEYVKQQHQQLPSVSKVDRAMFAEMFRTAMEMAKMQQQQQQRH